MQFILKNVVYIGRMIFNRVSTAKYHHYSDGRVVKGGSRGPTPESDSWIVHEDHHESIIDVATFDKAQAKLARKKVGVVKGKAANYLFAGKLRCGRCGSTLFGLKNADQDESKVHLRYSVQQSQAAWK